MLPVNFFRQQESGSIPAALDVYAIALGSNGAAALEGNAIAQGLASTAWFEWGTDTNYGNRTDSIPLGNGWAVVSARAILTGLLPDEVYHLRLVVSNSTGVARSGDFGYWAKDLPLNGPNPMLVECHTPFTDPGVGSVNLTITTGGNVDANSPGSYTLIYSATNASGARAATQRTVVVTDTTAPVLTLAGANPLLIPTDSVFQDPGASAVDACAGPAANIVVSGVVNTSAPGLYWLTYVASDGNGNQSTNLRSVSVYPRPTINQLSMPTSDAIRLTFNDTSGFVFDAYVSTNLSNWVRLGAASNVGGSLFEFRDPESTNFRARFYQLRGP